MTRSLRSVWHRRRTAVLLATATIAASFGWALAPTSSSAQTADPPFTVELSQTTGLLDGDVVKVTIRGAPGVQLNPGSSSMRVCRPGVSYTAPADLIPTNGKCPANGTSSAAEASGQIFAIADGTRAEGDIAVGVGVGEWEVFGQPNFTLACGPGAPCLLVLQVGTTDSVGGPITRHFVTRELTFADPDPTRGCGGRNPAAVSTAASDRMQDIWARSTLAQCTSGGASGASTSFAPTGEGEGIAAFTAGTRDLVYTAAGYRPFLGLDPAPRRPAVYTPVALNAVVIAAIGGQLVNDDPQWPVGLAKPYSEPIRMTAAEAATLLGQGGFFFNSTPGIGPEFLARNPQIGPTAYNPNDRFANAAAVQDATAVSLFATSFLDEQAPGHWVSRPDVQARSRGVDAQLARAVPGFESSLTPVSQKIQTFAFRNGVQQNATTPGPGWALTDYATAIDLGLTPVAIQNAAGEFVEPTPESIAAGVATMTKESDGRRVPDPDTTASGAYPMAMIEYAMAPAEQLVDQTCAPRAESQQVLTSWLSFLTGAGQDALGPDFVPLTPELAAEARGEVRPDRRVALDRGVRSRQPRGAWWSRGHDAGVGRSPDRGNRQRDVGLRRWQWQRRGERRWRRRGRGCAERVDARRAGGCRRAGRGRRTDVATVPRHRGRERDHLAAGAPPGRGPHVGRGVPDLRPPRPAGVGVRSRAGSRRGQATRCAASRCHAVADVATSSLATGIAHERAVPVV